MSSDGKIYGNGVDQVDIYNMLVNLTTNWSGILAKLDADSGVNFTDYNSRGVVTLPTTGHQDTVISPRGMSRQALYTIMNNFRTCILDICGRLDTDSQVLATNYVALVTANIAVPVGTFTASTLSQSQLVNGLEAIRRSINYLNGRLDLDGGITGNDYAATWNITDTILESGTSIAN